MNIKIATPISVLFAQGDKTQIGGVIELTDALEIRDISTESSVSLPRLYHSDLSIVEKWSGEEINRTASIIEKNNVILVSFHVASCFANAPIGKGMFQPRGRAMSETEMLENTKSNINGLRSKAGLVEMAIENNNFFPTGAYKLVTEAKFINKLLDNNKLGLLLDLAHAKITAYNRGMRLDEYLKSFNLDRVVQVHLSGVKETNEIYTDAHSELADNEWEEFKKIIKFCSSLQFVTIEYYREISTLVNMLSKLRKIIDEKNIDSSS